MSGATEITAAIEEAKSQGSVALVSYLTAGFPRREEFAAHLAEIAEHSDVVEVGVPFTDPTADGVTIQESSRVALEQGVTLSWILDEIAARDWAAPILLMSYLNPLLAIGDNDIGARCRAAGVAGVICPDLPLEECGDLDRTLAADGVALVQLVTPVTPLPRLAELCAASRGFVYAVTVAGITGGARSGGPGASSAPDMASVTRYLDAVRAASSVPVCAGFGIRSAEQVRALAGHADGVIVGSALVEVLENGASPGAFLRSLRAG